jgi:hypothetical protein
MHPSESKIEYPSAVNADWESRLVEEANATWGRAMDLRAPSNTSTVANILRDIGSGGASYDCQAFFSERGFDLAGEARSVDVVSSEDVSLQGLDVYTFDPDFYRPGTGLSVWNRFHPEDTRTAAITSSNLGMILVNESGHAIANAFGTWSFGQGVSGFRALAIHELLHVMLPNADHSQWASLLLGTDGTLNDVHQALRAANCF